jgi:acetyltransferase-like isoleucine patch superfamily enzyme
MAHQKFTRDEMKAFMESGVAVIGEHSYGAPILRYPESPGGYRFYLGHYCSIADGVEIFLGGYHRPDWISTYPFPAFEGWSTGPRDYHECVGRGDVVIGSDVWLGSRCCVLAGVRIGDGAVVGAQAVVTKDVPPYAIVAGNPAQVVKYRFPDDVVRELLEIAWWNWSEAKIRANLPRLLSGDVDGFIAEHRVPRAALG